MRLRTLLPILLLSWLSGYVPAVQVSEHRLGADTGYETEYRIIDSGQPGPTVAIFAGREDDPAATAVLEQIQRWPLRAGRLVVFPSLGSLAEAEEGFFLNFPADAEDSPGGDASAAMWEYLTELRPEYLVKFRSSRAARSANSDAYGNTILAGETVEALNAASASVEMANRLIEDESMAFQRLRRPARGSLIHAAADHLDVHAMWVFVADQPDQTRRDLYTAAVYALAERAGMVEPGHLLANVDDRLLQTVDHTREGEGKLRVALFRAAGVGSNGIPNVKAALEHNDGVYTAIVDDEAIRRGVLKDFHVAVFCGGSGSRQAASLREDGREMVRQFVHGGGGYVGICAGAYLACSNYSWGLKIINAQTRDSRWRRGRGYVEAELTDAGRAFFGDRHSVFSVRYANGPIIEPAGVAELAEFTTLAHFRTELAENDTIPGLMLDTPAIAIGSFGEGRVGFVSPHPESSEDLHYLVERLILWTAGE